MRLAGTVVLAALFVAAAPAEARRVAVTQPTWQFGQGPTLVGDRVAWAEEGCRGGCDPTSDDFPDRFRLFWSGPGGRERVAREDGLRTSFDEETSRSESVSYGMSSNRVALLRSIVQRGPGTLIRETERLQLGFLASSRSSVFECQGDVTGQTEGERPPLDMDEATLVYDAASCGRPSRLAIRDLATESTQLIDQPAGSRLELVRVSGPYVAVLRVLPGDVRQMAVYRAGAAAEAYTAPVPAGLSAEDVDVQEDGTAALVSRSREQECDDGVLGWYSILEPYEHRLPEKPCPNGVRIAGGRIVVFMETDEGGGQELRSLGLQGDTQTLLRLGEGGRRLDHPVFRAPSGPAPFLDFDGFRAAYTLRDCSDNQGIHVTAVAEAPEEVGYVGCPSRIRSTRVSRPRRRRVTVGVRCPRGCAGSASIRRGRSRLAYTPYFALGPNRRGRIRLIDEGASRALRRRFRVRVKITIRGMDRAGRDQRPVTRRVLLTR